MISPAPAPPPMPPVAVYMAKKRGAFAGRDGKGLEPLTLISVLLSYLFENFGKINQFLGLNYYSLLENETHSPATQAKKSFPGSVAILNDDVLKDIKNNL